MSRFKVSNETRIKNVENIVNENTIKIKDIENKIKMVDDLYNPPNVYGIEADFINNMFTRIAGAVGKTPGEDFNNINAFGGRKRCILTDDGVVLAYWGEEGYTETGALTQPIVKNNVTYPIGTPVQVMVEQPKFYYKVVPLLLENIQNGIGFHLRRARYYVSDVRYSGMDVHPAFVRNGVEKDKIYLSAYEGCIQKADGTYLLNDEQTANFNADKLSSIANAKPASGVTQQLTRANTRRLAENRGTGWQISDVLSAAVTQLLFIIEYASFNTQANIGLGVVNKADGSTNMSELTGATSNLGNASGMADGTNGLVSVTYRGEENFWGNIWSWIDGLNIEAYGIHEAWWADHGFVDNTKASPYKNCGFTLAKANGYISAFGYSEDCDFLFLPSETVGNSSLPVGDNLWQNHSASAWWVAVLGGRWPNGLAAGAFCWNVSYSSGFRSWQPGGRAVYVPQAS